MKRHSCFVPLSRDHHEGLLLALRLQQGEQALLRLWSHDPHWQAGYVVNFFNDALAHHFDIEEQDLFPLAEMHLPREHSAGTSRLREEHLKLKNYVETLHRPGTQVSTLLLQFGKLLEDHIRREEREYFPLCEKYIPTHVLDQLGTAIALHHSKRGSP